MKGIGGNTLASIQISTSAKNIIGEAIKTWSEAQSIKGWLDLSSGDSRYTAYDAKIQESTHVFVADWVPLNASIKSYNSRLVVDGKAYDILLIDDPMGMHEQLEIYLKFVGVM